MENEKITLKEFLNSKELIAIHCPTKEQAKKLLKRISSFVKGFKFEHFLFDNCFCVYKKETCYTNNGFYSSIPHLKERKIKIYEFEEKKI